MSNAFANIEQIRAAVSALPFTATVHGVSVSHRAGGAIVTVERWRGDFVTYEWAEVNPAQLYWGHYDLTETEADADHAERFARLTGVRS